MTNAHDGKLVHAGSLAPGCTAITMGDSGATALRASSCLTRAAVSRNCTDQGTIMESCFVTSRFMTPSSGEQSCELRPNQPQPTDVSSTFFQRACVSNEGSNAGPEGLVDGDNNTLKPDKCLDSLQDLLIETPANVEAGEGLVIKPDFQ